MDKKELSSHELVKKLKREMATTIVFLLAGITVLVVTTIAWFMNNKATEGFGMSIEALRGSDIRIEEEVTAIRTYLSDREMDNITMNRREDGLLEVVQPSEYMQDDVTVLFGKMLPGEYVDITFDVFMSEAMDQKDYCIYMADFQVGEKPTSEEEALESKGWFFIRDDEGNPCYYNILGIYTYEIVDIVKKADGSSVLSEAMDPRFFGSYEADVDSEAAPEEMILYRGVWDKEYETVSVTIRISADFKQFYELLMETGSDISNLLSEKGFVVEKIGVGLE